MNNKIIKMKENAIFRLKVQYTKLGCGGEFFLPIWSQHIGFNSISFPVCYHNLID
jgi:hypothetical protein